MSNTLAPGSWLRAVLRTVRTVCNTAQGRRAVMARPWWRPALVVVELRPWFMWLSLLWRLLAPITMRFLSCTVLITAQP